MVTMVPQVTNRLAVRVSTPQRANLEWQEQPYIVAAAVVEAVNTVTLPMAERVALAVEQTEAMVTTVFKTGSLPPQTLAAVEVVPELDKALAPVVAMAVPAY